MFRGFSCIFLVRPCCPFYQNESFHLQAGDKITDDNVKNDGEGSPAGPFTSQLLASGGPAPVLQSQEPPARPPLLLLGPGGDFVTPVNIQIR